MVGRHVSVPRGSRAPTPAASVESAVAVKSAGILGDLAHQARPRKRRQVPRDGHPRRRWWTKGSPRRSSEASKRCPHSQATGRCSKLSLTCSGGASRGSFPHVRAGRPAPGGALERRSGRGAALGPRLRWIAGRRHRAVPRVTPRWTGIAATLLYGPSNARIEATKTRIRTDRPTRLRLPHPRRRDRPRPPHPRRTLPTPARPMTQPTETSGDPEILGADAWFMMT